MTAISPASSANPKNRSIHLQRRYGCPSRHSWVRQSRSVFCQVFAPQSGTRPHSSDWLVLAQTKATQTYELVFPSVS